MNIINRSASADYLRVPHCRRNEELYIVRHKKAANLFFVCKFVQNQRILMQFSLIDLEMNGTCDSMNFTHLTHYLVKVKTPKL